MIMSTDINVDIEKNLIEKVNSTFTIKEEFTFSIKLCQKKLPKLLKILLLHAIIFT